MAALRDDIIDLKVDMTWLISRQQPCTTNVQHALHQREAREVEGREVEGRCVVHACKAGETSCERAKHGNGAVMAWQGAS